MYRTTMELRGLRHQSFESTPCLARAQVSTGVAVTAETKRAALTAARTPIAAVLEVDPESFDLEA